MAEILIGTSGYSYPDWVGPVYPVGTPSRDFLTLYAKIFQVVELNFTYYRQPTAPMISRMIEATPPGFRFSLKAHQNLTHKISEDLEKEGETFHEGIKPLIDSGRLSALLFQFPYSFHYTPESRGRIQWLCKRFDGLPLAVEFRNSEWMRDSVYQGLRERNVALVSVDEPDLPRLLKPSTEVTSRLAYIRFHGRNKAAWWSGDTMTRYDYLYHEGELQEWVPRIRAMVQKSSTLLIFFNNHRKGMAVQNAREMRAVLEKEELV